MDFKQVEAEFNKLKVQFETKTLSETDFKSKLEDLMVQDESGHWWMIGYETGLWYRNDGSDWLRVDPPGYEPPGSTVMAPVATPAVEIAGKVSGNGAGQGSAQSAAYPRTVAQPPAAAKKTPFLLSWFGRILLGLGVGFVFSIFTSVLDALFGYPLSLSFFELLPVWLIACGLAGWLIYPRISSVIIMLAGSIVAGLIGIFDGYYYSFIGVFLNFIIFGAVFGFPGGALISRILHWVKVIK